MVASVLVRVRLAAPAAWAPVLAVMVVLLTTVTFVAALAPRVTVAPGRKPVPVMVTAVPPGSDPVVGLIEVTVTAGGAGVTVTPAVLLSEQPAPVVTVKERVSVPGPPAVKVMVSCRFRR